MEAGKYCQYKISHLYRYNAKAASNLAGLAVNRQVGGHNGYFPNPKPAHFPDELVKETIPQKTDSKKLEYVQRFIDLCQQNNALLVFMISPKYSVVDAHHYDILKKIAQKNNMPFLDYHTRGLFLNHPEYFKDGSHLWDKGAMLYSSVFASDLKNILKQRIE